MTRIVVVDEHDEAIGIKNRDDMTFADKGRVSALWLEDMEGNVLLAQRAFSKRNSPGKWSCAVAGTVEEGEDYDDNMVKEIAEEIGMSVEFADLEKRHKEFFQGSTSAIFVQWYFLQRAFVVEDITYPEDEVAQVRLVSKAELRAWFDTHPEDFVRHFHTTLDAFCA